VDIDTTTSLSAPHGGPNSETCEIPVLGCTSPAAELRLLTADMDRVLSPVKDLLLRIGVTFDQALAIYNDVPLLLTTADLADAELMSIVSKHVEVL
jgi:hypothetical protein